MTPVIFALPLPHTSAKHTAVGGYYTVNYGHVLIHSQGEPIAKILLCTSKRQKWYDKSYILDYLMMNIDLHTHTYFSDGKLSPDELVQRAMANGVEILSITDHDTVNAYQHFNNTNTGITLIPGIEFSTFWHKIGIHIVGLNVDLDSDAL